MTRDQAHHYFRALDDPGNAMRVDFVTRRGAVTQFTVQYEILLGGAWVPIVRFDTAHGGPHRDILGRDDSVLHQDFDWLPRQPPYNWALTAAQRDISENWRAYRITFLGRRK